MSSASIHRNFDIFSPLRRWLDKLKIVDSHFAHSICRLIPSQCPFERNINIFGKVVHIPALCKLNPLYYELFGLRLRALTYLSDVCGEDIKQYIS